MKSLTLPATPRAVKLARDWVGGLLDDIGRHDLVESAELGVSELVTNAIMHSAPPVAVRLRGTREHPRIEVADRSLVPPRPPGLPEEEEDLLATFGRGLALVALHAAAWGSDLDDDGNGKTVWFEPVGDFRDDAEIDVDGTLFDLEEAMSLRDYAEQPDDTLEIQLIGMPVLAFREARRHYHELRREMRLLALANPERYPFAAELSEVALQVEQERRQSRGLDRLARAEEAGEEKCDLRYVVPTSAPTTMGRMADLLERSVDFFDREALLALRPTDAQRELFRWYFGEFVRQAAGEEPRPWLGGYGDEPPARAG